METAFWDLEGIGGSFHIHLVQEDKNLRDLESRVSRPLSERHGQSTGASDSLPIILCHVDKEWSLKKQNHGGSGPSGTRHSGGQIGYHIEKEALSTKWYLM